MSNPNLKGKDAKAKDTKAKGGKGAAADSDKNAPKPIEIEYPEIAAEPDFVLIEKSFDYGKSKPTGVLPKRSAKSQMSAGPAASAAGASSQGNAPAVDVLALKKQARLQELQGIYSMVRALPFTMAIVLKLNYVPPPPPPVEAEDAEPVADTKLSNAKNAKGKKK